MVCLSRSSHCIFFLSSISILFEIFVSRFQGSKSNSLPVALIWSISCTHGFDWKKIVCFSNFFSPNSSHFSIVWATDAKQVSSQRKSDVVFFITCISWSVSLSIHLSVFPSICLVFNPSVHWFLLQSKPWILEVLQTSATDKPADFGPWNFDR